MVSKLNPAGKFTIINLNIFPADLYISWVMEELSFDFTPASGTIDTILN